MAWPSGEANGQPERQARAAVIGFGARGRVVAQALLRCGFDVAVFDRQFAFCHSRPARAVHRMAVCEHASVAGAVAGRALVIVATAGDAAIEVARSAADHLEPGCDYIDASGCAPRSIAPIKRALGDVVRLSMTGRETLLDRARSLPLHAPLADVAGHFTAGPAKIAAAYGGAQILPFAPLARAVQRLPSVQAA